MKDAPDLMIDLETFGTLPGSAFFSIGLMQFWPRRPPGEVRFGAAKTIAVCMTSALMHGLSVDQRTIDWWRTQPADLRTSMEGGGKPLGQALWALDDFWREYRFDKEHSCVWAHGVHFDISLLENAYARLARPVPWKYNRVRDTRTLYDAARCVGEWSLPERDAGYREHVAAHDAGYQAECVIAAHGHLRSASKTEPR